MRQRIDKTETFRLWGFQRGRNWGGEATVFGWLARVPAADWSPGDSRCRGPSARLSFPRALPPSRPPLIFALSLSLSPPLLFKLSVVPTNLSPSSLSIDSTSVSLALSLSLSSSSSFCSSTLFTSSMVTVGFSTALFCPPTLPFRSLHCC